MTSDRLRLKFAIYVVVAGVIVAVAATALSLIRFFGPARDRAISLVPKDAAVYATAFLEPSTSQKRALRDLLAHFPAAGDLESAETFLDRILTDAFETSGLDYREEIKPWVGSQFGVFISSISLQGDVDGALLVATDDVDATLTALEKNRAFESVQVEPAVYRGHEYLVEADGTATGVVTDFLVVGSKAGIRAAIDAVEGESLADSDAFTTATSRLAEDRLALFYLDVPSLLRDVAEAPGLLPPTFSLPRLVGDARAAVVGYVRPDAIVFESTGAAGSDALRTASLGSDTGWLPLVPADSWAALDINDVGSVIESLISAIDQAGVPGLASTFLAQQLRAETGLDLRRDILSWIGDAGLFVRGPDWQRIVPGAVIASADREASERAVKKMYAYLLSRDFRARRAELPGIRAEGFVVLGDQVQQPVYVLSLEDRVIVALGRRTARVLAEGGSVLGSEPVFARAQASLGEDFDESAFIDLQRFISVFEDSTGALPPAYTSEIKPNLDALDHVVFGSKLSGDEIVQRLVIGVR